MKEVFKTKCIFYLLVIGLVCLISLSLSSAASATIIDDDFIVKHNEPICIECCMELEEAYPDGPQWTLNSMFGHKTYLSPWNEPGYLDMWDRCHVPPAATPIPAPILLLGTGLFWIGILRRKAVASRQKQQ